MTVSHANWTGFRAASALLWCLFLCVSLIATSTALAQPGTLRDERVKDKQSRALSEEAKFTSEICGTRIVARIKWDTFVKRDGTLRRSYHRDCDHALSAIERHCREGKQSQVAEKIKRLECGAGVRRRVMLDNGTLLFAVTDRPTNDHQFVYDFLKSKL